MRGARMHPGGAGPGLVSRAPSAVVAHRGQAPSRAFIATTDPQVAGRFGKGAASGVVPACECRVSLAALAPQLRLEVQYVLQCRRDERLARTPVTTVARMVRLLAGLPVTSLLDWDEETFRASFGRPAPRTRDREP
jgi:hypothetical protein